MQNLETLHRIKATNYFSNRLTQYKKRGEGSRQEFVTQTKCYPLVNVPSSCV